MHSNSFIGNKFALKAASLQEAARLHLLVAKIRKYAQQHPKESTLLSQACQRKGCHHLLVTLPVFRVGKKCYQQSR